MARGGSRGAAIKARRDRESLTSCPGPTFHSVAYAPTEKATRHRRRVRPTHREWYKTMDIYLCRKTRERLDDCEQTPATTESYSPRCYNERSELFQSRRVTLRNVMNILINSMQALLFDISSRIADLLTELFDAILHSFNYRLISSSFFSFSKASVNCAKSLRVCLKIVTRARLHALFVCKTCMLRLSCMLLHVVWKQSSLLPGVIRDTWRNALWLI